MSDQGGVLTSGPSGDGEDAIYSGGAAQFSDDYPSLTAGISLPSLAVMHKVG